MTQLTDLLNVKGGQFLIRNKNIVFATKKVLNLGLIYLGSICCLENVLLRYLSILFALSKNFWISSMVQIRFSGTGRSFDDISLTPSVCIPLQNFRWITAAKVYLQGGNANEMMKKTSEG